MSRPRLLDLFSGAGGCSVGYHRAGFDVTGVDIEPHADYPFDFIVADAMEVLRGNVVDLDSFDAIHASPPCPRYSTVTPASTRDQHPDLLPPSRELLMEWGGVWVIENVPGAPMPDAVVVCGPAVGLPDIRRHRLFESNVHLMSPGCACGATRPWTVTGDHPDSREFFRPDGTRRARKPLSVEHAQRVLGIDWMTSWDDLADAIPPAYTELIGEQLIEAMARAA